LNFEIVSKSSPGGVEMDTLITMVRFPMGIAVIPLVTAFRLLAVPIEFVLGVIALPIAAIFLKRNEIKKSWLRQWPCMALRRIPKDLETIWRWIFAD
jgi:hypothetical protein